MLKTHSFIDLLFILLCSTIVLLSQSIRLGAVKTAPARVGASAIAGLAAESIQLAVITDDGLVWEQKVYASPETLVESLDRADPVVLTVGHEAVSHHRVMRIWSDLNELNFDVKLGAEPRHQDRK